MDKEIKATFKLDLTELKELLNKASDQVEQLQETLDEIANFKIQVSNREAEEIAPQEAMRKIQTIKITIFENAHEAMKQAVKERDSAMVAAIAEIIKSI